MLKAYYQSQRLGEAVEAYEELFEMQPEALSVLRRLVLLYGRLGTPERSIPAYKTFLESSAESAEMIPVYNEFGVRRLTPGSGLAVHRNEAAAAFRAALDLATGRSNVLRRNLAEALWQLGEKEEALSVLDGLTQADEAAWSSLTALELAGQLVEKDRRMRSAWAVPVRSVPDPIESAFVVNEACARGGAGLGEPMEVEGDVRRPEKLRAPQPQYTKAARRKRIQGAVVVRTIIDEAGCVRATQLLEGPSADLNEEVVKMIRQWTFKPAMLKGQPVAVYVNWTVNFRLQ